MKTLFIAALAFVLVVGSTHQAAALKISPFKARLDPGSGDATQVFRIENNSAESAAVQISVQTWEMQPDGTEINDDAEDDFVVFPAQLVLKPHENRAVRVQWAGAGMPESEKPYRVLAEQIPISLQDTQPAGSALRFLLRFKAGLYITPPHSKSDVVVEKIEMRPGILRLTLYNQGDAHTLMRNPTLHLMTHDGRIVTLAQEKLPAIDGANMHAGGRRFFDIAIPSDLPSVKSANLDYDTGF